MTQDRLPHIITTLVIVPGHAVYNGDSLADAYEGSQWVGTYSGYKYNDEVMNYVRHIQRGIDLADRDPRCLLVFSGGKTRKGTPTSEAASYYELATQHGWFSVPAVAQRCRLEEFATDSFENLLFGIQLFRLLHPTEDSPQKVTVVGLRFKRERYQMHANAIIDKQVKGIAPFIFRYDDVNDVPDYVLEAGSGEGEELTRAQFSVWPLGDGGDLLKKRKNRDPHGWYASKPYP